MNRPRKTLAALALTAVLVGVAAPSARADVGPDSALAALWCMNFAGAEPNYSAMERVAYDGCTWRGYAMVVFAIAAERHVRFTPVDRSWAEAEQDWWVRLSWDDYGGALYNTIFNHHVRFVPV